MYLHYYLLTKSATFMAGNSLVLPAETEQRVKRRALNACQDNLRKVVELTRKVPQMVEHFSKGNKILARQLFSEIKKDEEEVIEARRMVSRELAEIGAILISREDFLRFTNLSSEIADFSEGIAYYLVEIIEHNWNVPSDLKKDLLKLSEAVFDTVLKLRETVLVLSYGSAKTLEKAKDVEIAERTVDDLYRGLTIKILRSKLDLPVLLLLRDVLQLLENSADKAEDAADTARILSFIM
jgi:predicted phosphate transport protein (TIGR00153 family)